MRHNSKEIIPVAFDEELDVESKRAEFAGLDGEILHFDAADRRPMLVDKWNFHDIA